MINVIRTQNMHSADSSTSRRNTRDMQELAELFKETLDNAGAERAEEHAVEITRGRDTVVISSEAFAMMRMHLNRSAN